MIKNFLSLGLIAALGAGCASIVPPSLTADDPATPEAPEGVAQLQPSSLLAGSEPLAQWLATNRVDGAHDSHSHHDHGHAPAAKPSAKPAGKEHQH